MPPSQRWLTKGMPQALRVVLDGALGLLLRADEENHATVGDEVAHVGVTRLDAGERLCAGR